MEREKLKSRLGFILLSAGCAIGIGNVWKFPYMAGQGGGGAFVLFYLLFLVILGLPIMSMEFAVGRASHKSPVHAYSLLIAKFLDDFFIAGKLNVTTQQNISQPHERIEPMNRQQEKTKRLPPMVFAANVRLFVGNNVLQILTIHVEREIDSRFDNAQDKRRTYILTLENVALVANSGIHFTT